MGIKIIFSRKNGLGWAGSDFESQAILIITSPYPVRSIFT